MGGTLIRLVEQGHNVSFSYRKFEFLCVLFKVIETDIFQLDFLLINS
jgi:hypothetical protein